MNDEIVKNEIQIKKNFASDKEKSNEFDDDEKINSIAQINRKTIDKTIDKNIKIDFNKTFKSKKK